MTITHKWFELPFFNGIKCGALQRLLHVLGQSHAVPAKDRACVADDERVGQIAEGDVEQEANSDEVPSYLVSAASAAKDSMQEEKEDKQEEVDEFGLPKVPARKLEA